MTPNVEAVRTAMREDIAAFDENQMIYWPSTDGKPSCVAALAGDLKLPIRAWAFKTGETAIAQAMVGTGSNTVVIDIDESKTPFLEARPERQYNINSETEAAIFADDPAEAIEAVFEDAGKGINDNLAKLGLTAPIKIDAQLQIIRVGKLELAAA